MEEDKVMGYSRGELVDEMAVNSLGIYLTLGLESSQEYHKKPIEELAQDLRDEQEIKRFFGVDKETAKIFLLTTRYGCPPEKLPDILEGVL